MRQQKFPIFAGFQTLLPLPPQLWMLLLLLLRIFSSQNSDDRVGGFAMAEFFFSFISTYLFYYNCFLLYVSFASTNCVCFFSVPFDAAAPVFFSGFVDSPVIIFIIFSQFCMIHTYIQILYSICVLFFNLIFFRRRIGRIIVYRFDDWPIIDCNVCWENIRNEMKI